VKTNKKLFNNKNKAKSMVGEFDISKVQIQNVFVNKLIRTVFYILAIILPIQTILVQFLTSKFGVSEFVALWKEVLIFILILYFLFQIFRILWGKFGHLGNSKFWRYFLENSWLLIIFFFLNLVILLNSFIFNSASLKVFFYGYRFEIFWLALFVITVTYLNLVGKSNFLNLQEVKNSFYTKLRNSVLIGFIISAIFSLISIIFGQQNVLKLFGFVDNTDPSNSLLTQALTCNVVDFGSSICRLPGTFSSPNHFAGYLLLVLPIILVLFVDYFNKWREFHATSLKPLQFSKTNPLWILLAISTGIVLICLFLLLTISRFSWLGIFVFLGLIIIYFGYKLKLFNLIVAKIFFAILLLIPIFIGVLAINLNPETTLKNLPIAIAKPSSTIEHYRHTMTSLEVLITSQKYLTGFGLGSSGSVATSQYQDLEQNPIYKDYSYVALKWFMFPHRVTIPENWYLALVLNGGFIYAILYLVLLLYPARSIMYFFGGKVFDEAVLKQLFFSLGFFCILIANLFLQIWENQTIAIYWTLLFVISVAYKSIKPFVNKT